MRHGVRERHRHLAHGLRGDRQRRRSGARRAAAARGDATAGETLQLAGRYAGLALAAAAQILDPVEMSQLGEEIGILDAAAFRPKFQRHFLINVLQQMSYVLFLVQSVSMY